MSDFTHYKVNYHELEERERLQLLNYVQLHLVEYMTLNNQNIQLDPILQHLRLIARLQKWGSPNYGLCLNTINEIKQMAKHRELTAARLYLMIQQFMFPGDQTPFSDHVKEFFNMLIENKIFHFLIGPPFSVETCLPDEKVVWKTYDQILEDIQIHMQVAPFANTNNSKHNWGDKIKLNWTVGKYIPLVNHHFNYLFRQPLGDHSPQTTPSIRFSLLVDGIYGIQTSHHMAND